MLVTGGTHAGEFFRLLGEGRDVGVDRLFYATRRKRAGSPRRSASRSGSSVTTACA